MQIIIKNPEIFKQYRSLAVTDPYKIKVGTKYYSNTYPREFIVTEVLTQTQQRILDGFKGYGSEYVDDTVPQWFTHKDCSNSLRDRNCGASYNPWLIFEDEEIRDKYEAQVEIVYDNSDFSDIFLKFEYYFCVAG